MIRNLKFIGFVVCVFLLVGIIVVFEMNEYFKKPIVAYISPDEGDANAVIRLGGDSITIDDEFAATIDGSVITITKGGQYEISGVLYNGQIIVDVDKETKVTLLLNGVDVTCLDSAPLYVKSADRVRLELVIGTENIFTDGEFYTFPSQFETKPNACIYSRDDVTIAGPGSLIVNANYNNGIGCSNDLRISDGIISVTAYKNGLKGNDSVTIERGKVTVRTQIGDGIKTDDSSNTGKGYVLIEGGEVYIDSGEDAIQADNLVIIRSTAQVTVKALKFDINCANVNVDEGSLISKEPA